MGNELTRSHQPYLVRQISESSGKDEATIKEFYTTFEKECPSGVMTPEDFSKLYAKVCCDLTVFVTRIWLQRMYVQCTQYIVLLYILG